LLTSLTTFAGLTPLMLERSVQAQLLIPMAISLAFGVLFATAITLILVPALYLIIEDLKALFQRTEPEPGVEPQATVAPFLLPERKRAS
jgi:Cu/Ag efflux pump CusA